MNKRVCVCVCAGTSRCHLQKAEVKPLISVQLCCQVTRQAIPFECTPNFPTTPRLYDCRIVRLLCNRHFISSRALFELHYVELDNRFSLLSSHYPTGSLSHCANHYLCLFLCLCSSFIVSLSLILTLAIAVSPVRVFEFKQLLLP